MILSFFIRLCCHQWLAWCYNHLMFGSSVPFKSLGCRIPAIFWLVVLCTVFTSCSALNIVSYFMLIYICSFINLLICFLMLWLPIYNFPYLFKIVPLWNTCLLVSHCWRPGISVQYLWFVFYRHVVFMGVKMLKVPFVIVVSFDGHKIYCSPCISVPRSS